MDDPQRTFGLIVLAIGVVFLVVGLLLLAISGRMQRSRRDFADTAVRTRGTITDITWDAMRRGDGDVSQQARVRLDFVLADGRPARAWSFETSSPAAGKKGQEVDVLYDPADPDRVRVADDRAALRVARGFFVAFAGVFAAVGLLIAVAGAALLAA